MLINFNEIVEKNISQMNGGNGEISAKMYVDKHRKIIPCKIHTGSSIGSHKHTTSDDINYILLEEKIPIETIIKVTGLSKEEILSSGVCHICKKGSEHSIINTGKEDLILLTIVVEQ